MAKNVFTIYESNSNTRAPPKPKTNNKTLQRLKNKNKSPNNETKKLTKNNIKKK